jgi:rare lipoprotein A
MNMRLILLLSALFFPGLAAFAQRDVRSVEAEARSKGIASYYHDKFVGRLTANGEIFDNGKFTAASNKLRLGTYVKVTNLSNGRVVYVRINDRMAATNKREIDLASVAADQLGFISQGLAKVIVEIVPAEEGKRAILAQRELISSPRQNEL